MLYKIKIIVEKYHDGYVAYPLGIKGGCVGQGDSYAEALADAESAVRFHIETFGTDELDLEHPILDASMGKNTPIIRTPP